MEEGKALVNLRNDVERNIAAVKLGNVTTNILKNCSHHDFVLLSYPFDAMQERDFKNLIVWEVVRRCAV